MKAKIVIEMPECCDCCPCIDESQEIYVCSLGLYLETNESISIYEKYAIEDVFNKKPDWCPLQPVEVNDE